MTRIVVDKSTHHAEPFDLVINSAAFQNKIITAALLASMLALLWFSQSTV